MIFFFNAKLLLMTRTWMKRVYQFVNGLEEKDCIMILSKLENIGLHFLCALKKQQILPLVFFTCECGVKSFFFFFFTRHITKLIYIYRYILYFYIFFGKYFIFLQLISYKLYLLIIIIIKVKKI